MMIFFWILFPLTSLAETVPSLTLDNYLQQVKKQNLDYKASKGASGGAFDASVDGDLLLMPNLFANYQHIHDEKPTVQPPFQGDRTVNDVLSFGVSENTPFGLSAKLSYNIFRTDIRNAPLLTQPKYTTASPMFELSQSFWRNGFGAETRAQVASAEASQLATAYAEEFRAKGVEVQAELTYWQLTLAREAVKFRQDVLERAKKLLGWAKRRVSLNLSERAEALQAQAAYQVRELEYQIALDEERTASRAFNSARNVEADNVPEQLQELRLAEIKNIQAPKREKFRDDVKAADQTRRLAVATQTLAVERNSPTFDVFGSFALNSKESSFGSGLSESFDSSHPAYIVGVKFSTPLHIGMMMDSIGGHKEQRIAADVTYRKKVFDQEQDWSNLMRQLDESKHRLRLAELLERAQDEKLKNEKNRLSHGRTTTFQVLQFEQDYQESQAGLLRAEAEVLRLIAQMKLFRGGK